MLREIREKIFLQISKKDLLFPKRYAIIFTASGCGAAGSALDWGSRGRKFKSCHSDHKNAVKTGKSNLYGIFVFSFFIFSCALNHAVYCFLVVKIRAFPLCVEATRTAAPFKDTASSGWSFFLTFSSRSVQIIVVRTGQALCAHFLVPFNFLWQSGSLHFSVRN